MILRCGGMGNGPGEAEAYALAVEAVLKGNVEGAVLLGPQQCLLLLEHKGFHRGLQKVYVCVCVCACVRVLMSVDVLVVGSYD